MNSSGASGKRSDGATWPCCWIPDTPWALEKLARANHGSTNPGHFTRLDCQPAPRVRRFPIPTPQLPCTRAGGIACRRAGRPSTEGAADRCRCRGGLSFQYFNTTTKDYGPDHYHTRPRRGVESWTTTADGCRTSISCSPAPGTSEATTTRTLTACSAIWAMEFVDVTQQAGLKEVRSAPGSPS